MNPINWNPKKARMKANKVAATNSSSCRSCESKDATRRPAKPKRVMAHESLKMLTHSHNTAR